METLIMMLRCVSSDMPPVQKNLASELQRCCRCCLSCAVPVRSGLNHGSLPVTCGMMPLCIHLHVKGAQRLSAYLMKRALAAADALYSRSRRSVFTFTSKALNAFQPT
jgi:hypothetical protein